MFRRVPLHVVVREAAGHSSSDGGGNLDVEKGGPKNHGSRCPPIMLGTNHEVGIGTLHMWAHNVILWRFECTEDSSWASSVFCCSVVGGLG
mmetsp:Transcript_53784/g.61782  ORF Transcript_53784/g.61782 Transcript_53784/m.61782 type:complete len:91 (+) Transcript_53784:539-811(+)